MSDPTQSPPRRCRATARSGARCQAWPIAGGAVCRMHGGSAPQVRRAAAERLKALCDPALVELEHLLAAESEKVRLGAALGILDRAGHGPNAKVEQSGDVTIRVVYADADPAPAP